MEESVNVELNDGGFVQLCMAWNFSQSVLQSNFSCSKSTITAARVHSILFGSGGVPQDELHFTGQLALSTQIIYELEKFLHQDDISRPSSCRSVIVDGKENTGSAT